MLLAIDDTDSPEGGCTTHAAIQVVAALPDVVLKSMPRLVRLNPNCPHKTRGNGAVVLELGRPGGPSTQIGSWHGEAIMAYPDAGPVADPNRALDAAWSLISEVAAPGSHPSVATADAALPAAAYWQAVQSEVTVEEAEALLPAWRGGGQSLAGCLGALAWPGPASSYEIIAYRRPEHRGTPRKVVAGPLQEVAGATFHTFEGDRLVCVPASPCPVLVGLRGRDPDALRDRVAPAVVAAAGEPLEGWVLWATNQASGDHVVDTERLSAAPVWASVRTPVEVVGVPEWGDGGHVHVPAMAADGACALWAFEPTKSFRHDVSQLRPGDRVEVVGALRERDIHMESLRWIEAVPRRESHPVCCGRSMQSRGTAAGFRCKVCGRRADEAEGGHMTPTGAFEVPVGARRHLHRPLAWDYEPAPAAVHNEE